MKVHIQCRLATAGAFAIGLLLAVCLGRDAASNGRSVPAHKGQGVARARTGITAVETTSIGRWGEPPGTSSANFCWSRTS